jgi:hypothetical protein
VTRAAPVNVIGRIAGLASLAAALAFVVVFFGAPVIAPSASARSERILVSSCGAGFRAEAPEPSASPQVRAVPPRGVVARSEERRSENRFVAPSPTAQVEPASEQDIELTETSTHRPPWARYRRRAQVFRPDSL